MKEIDEPGRAFVARYRTAHGVTVALCINKRLITHAVVLNEVPLRHRLLRGDERRYLEPLQYPLPKAVKRFRAAGRRLGMTSGARKLLKEAVK